MSSEPTLFSSDGRSRSLAEDLLRLVSWSLLVSGLLVASLGSAASAYAAETRVDPGFGGAGIAYVSSSSDGELIGPAEAIAIDRRDRIVAIGSDAEFFGVQARLTAKGKRDPSFGRKGLLYTTDFRRSNPIGLAYDVAINQRGELLTTGALGYPFDDPSSPYQCGFVSKQNTDGTLVRSFAQTGRQSVCLDRPDQVGIESRTIAQGKSGKTVVAGRTSHGPFRSGAFIARVRRDGKGLDKAF